MYYTVSDDPADVRYYTVRIDPAGPAVTFAGRHQAARARRRPYAATSLDPEGLALTKDRELIFTSEGIANTTGRPVRAPLRAGRDLHRRPARARRVHPERRGTRACARTSDSRAPAWRRTAASCSPPPRTRSSRTDPAATLTTRSPARILRHQLKSGRLDRQWTYLTDRSPSRRARGRFSVNGVVELLPLNNRFLLAMERSFSVGAPDTGNTIKIYKVSRCPAAAGRRPRSSVSTSTSSGSRSTTSRA